MTESFINSKFRISKMDCPSEERMIRMKLESFGTIRNLEFNIPDRELTIIHSGDSTELLKKLDELSLDSSIISSEKIDYDQGKFETNGKERKEQRTLIIVLTINFLFFLIEISTGIISGSIGLVADSLDMLADATVYGLSLLAVGKALSRKKIIAKLSGYFQIILAIIGFMEVIRRFIGVEDTPNYYIMIIISSFALMANISSLIILQKAQSDEAHIKASMIFTSNDIFVNVGVIAAGILVYLTNSNIPDLIVGSLVFIIVLRGALRILKL